jgi:hypothetical protein
LALVAACPAATFALSSKPILSPSLAWMALLTRANDPTPARLRPVTLVARRWQPVQPGSGGAGAARRAIGCAEYRTARQILKT